jgi:hypothetical protein
LIKAPSNFWQSHKRKRSADFSGAFFLSLWSDSQKQFSKGGGFVELAVFFSTRCIKYFTAFKTKHVLGFIMLVP